MSDDKQLQKVESRIVIPAISVDEALEASQRYEEFKARLVSQDKKRYVLVIQDKDYLKKEFWRKLQNFYNLQLECTNEWNAEEDGFGLTYYAVYRATAPNGAFCDGDGACSITEKGLKKTPHVARAIAHTRAKNRAISDLCGGGEVSAEEMSIVDAEYEVKSTTTARTKKEPQSAPQKKDDDNEPIDDYVVEQVRDIKKQLDDKIGIQESGVIYQALKKRYFCLNGDAMYSIDQKDENGNHVVSKFIAKEIYRALKNKLEGK